MYRQSETKNQPKESSKNDNKELIVQLEKQVSISIWIQTIGKIMEALYLTELLRQSEEIGTDPYENQIVQGVWIQTIGQFLEAVGVTKEVLSSENPGQLEGATLANIGDWIQGIGAIYEAHAGRQVIAEEREQGVSNLFVP
ncbi:hypothetical protein [Niallia endozanthoxylica]|uniref:Uncharacterized protein n=1 Tax=Niallia endozanthoxylica TaxID=2036016 RepID=A0A5J5GXT4_9BACI|nr:hypothetical protein [Niallia endozanthoxylica]KAA9012224.1 hypothetical protein F4V44_25925 [Niallia endozanthoxylica]